MACLNFRTPILENTFRWLFLYVLEVLVFQTPQIAFFIMQLCSFFLITFLFKESPKNNTNFHCHFHDEREFHRCFSLCFHHYFLRRYSSKSFFYWRNLKILISLKRHTFSIKHYSHKRYLLIRFILAYIRITKLLKKKKKKLFPEVYWRTWFCRIVYTG